MKLNVKIEGADQVMDKLNKVGKSISSGGMEQNFLRKAQEIASDAQRRAPVRTGLLKSSIVAKLLDKRGENPRVAIAAVDRKKAPHAHLVEFGTSRMAARPYFRPAVESKLPSLARGVESDLSKAVEDGAK